MGVLTGRRIKLRLAVDADVPPLAAIRRHPEVYRFWRGGDDLAAAVREDMAEDDSIGYVILLGDTIVGWIQWSAETEPDYRHAAMDIYLDADHRGQGIGPDALRTLARHLIEVEGFHRLEIDPAADNARAIRAYEKVGFKPVGITRQSERGPDGRWHDVLLMDLLAPELTTDSD